MIPPSPLWDTLTSGYARSDLAERFASLAPDAFDEVLIHVPQGHLWHTHLVEAASDGDPISLGDHSRRMWCRVRAHGDRPGWWVLTRTAGP